MMWKFDDQLREVVHSPEEITARIKELLAVSTRETAGSTLRVSSLSEAGALLRIAGKLPDAESTLLQALREAESLGKRARITTELKLAHVWQWQARYSEAELSFQRCIDQCRSDSELAPVLHFALQHAGKCAFDQADYARAASLFQQALELRIALKDRDLESSSRLAFDEAKRRAGANSPKFDATSYKAYRPLYPAATFAGFRALLVTGTAPRIADIGCGTGNSLTSAIRAGIQARWFALDPDIEMLSEARLRGELAALDVEYLNTSAEKTGIVDGSLDGITVGSAFHWMNGAATATEFTRILKSGAPCLIFEYQFPKALNNSALNEWIRRQFNQSWKAPVQVPRGNFEAVTRALRESARFRLIPTESVPMRAHLGVDELTGHILSQSRVQHFEATLTSPEEKLEFRSRLHQSLTELWGSTSAPLEFDFKLSLVLFQRA